MKHKNKNRTGFISIESVIVGAILISVGIGSINGFSAIATSSGSQREENLNSYIFQRVELTPDTEEPNPTNPTPNQPENPTVPTNPEPQEPNQPTNPGEPTAPPITPNEPVEPVTPVEPTNPSNPVTDGYVVNIADGFSLNNIGWLVGSFNASEENIVIPSQINDRFIYEIQQDAFNNKDIESVVFAPDSVITRIHARAFADNNITTISFPKTLTRIDLLSFKDNNLTKLVLPESLTTVEQNAFMKNNITEITAGSRLTTIRNNSFGAYSDGFAEAYQNGGAGTYRYIGGR